MRVKRAYVGISAIKRIRYFLPFEILLNVYNSLVQPHFDYCNVVWRNCSKNQTSKWPLRMITSDEQFHHQASSARKNLCICTLFAWIFFSNLLPWDILLCKTSQLYNSKRGLVEKFAHLP